MNHSVVTDHMADYLEGDLALDLRALVDAHLDGCPACAQEVREMQQTIRLLRALPEPEPPPMIAANVMRRIRAGETQPGLLDRIQRVMGGVLEPSFVLPGAALAVAALVVFAIQGRTPAPATLQVAPEASPLAADRYAAAPSVEEERAEIEAVDRAFGASAAARELAAAPAPPSTPAPRAEAPAIRAEQDPFAEPTRDAAPAEPAYAAREPLAREPWGDAPTRMPRAQMARPSASGSRLADSMLAQGFAPSGPAPTAASNPISGSFATALPTALARPVAGIGAAPRGENAGGEDPRDAWLARALESPVEFAHYIARHNLAEQELWVERLAERARSRGLLDEVVESLRAAGDEKSAWLADDFAAAAGSADSGAVEGEREDALDDRGPFDR